MVSRKRSMTTPLFRQWSGRIYLENPADPGNARVAFILSKLAGAPPATLSPLTLLDSGCLVDFPATSNPKALLADAQASADADPAIRLLVMSAMNSVLSQVKGQVGRRVIDGEVWFGNDRASSGPITGNGKWHINLADSTMRVDADRGLWFDLSGSDAGFYPDTMHKAEAPADESWAIYTIAGDRRAIWSLPVMLDHGLLSRLNVGASYFEQAGIEYDRSFYPFFDLADQPAQRFLLELDCGEPYPNGASRTRLTPPPHPLRSGVNDVHGRPVRLVPAGTGSARGSFTLAVAPEVVERGKVQALTHQFVPEGTFLASGAPGRLNLSMGTSNLETTTLDGDAQGVMLRFETGPALITSKDEFDAAAQDFRTAWLNVSRMGRSAAAELAMDPEGMQPYRYSAGRADGMAFAPSRLHVEGQTTIPFSPPLGLPADSPSLVFDRKRLTKARRNSFAARKNKSAKAGAVEDLRTPQGYLANRDATRMRELVFTRTMPRGTAVGLVPGERPDFGLIPIPNTKGEAILTELTARSQLLVVTRLEYLLQHFEAASLERLYMADWRVQKAAKGDATNFVILKHDDRPLYAPSGGGLLDDRRQWTEVDGLSLSNVEMTAVRQFVKMGVNAADDNKLFEPFCKRMTEPRWAGLICLNVVLGEMPEQLGALETLCKNLEVHHIGVDLTAIQNASEQAWKPAMFGVINQTEPGLFLPKDPTNFPMQLQLKELKLLVENDAVRTFECTVVGRPTELFETELDTKKKPDFALKGYYQSRVTPDGQRQDSYGFEVDGQFSYSFGKDFVLKTITITRAGLVTVVNPANRREKRGRLLLDGSLSFQKLGDVDLLGISKLDFFDLGVLFGPDLDNFDLAIEYPSLHFDFEALHGLNGINTDSFLAKLPFKLSGFRIGDFSLSKLGYFDFGKVPGIPGKLSDFKLGLDFDLDLGSLGALAKKLDRFKLNFVVGWVPKLDDLALGFRIETGGSGGGLDLGVEGIIQLTADHFHVGLNKQKQLILAADNTRLKVFSTAIPEDPKKTVSLYLLADLSKPSTLFEKIGWYGAYNDKGQKDGDGPVVIEHLALGQRIEIKSGSSGKAIQDIRTTRDVMAAIAELQSFDSDEKFLKFANDNLVYAPQRDWFVALAGSFFKLADIQLLLRDPDMYGIYVKLTAYEKLFVDLLYQKLADGVGRYSGEFDIREFIPQLDFGAFSVTMGVIGFEIYTNGGFLIDLGFPEHVDYSRSFVAQAGPFMGKGGFYIGRTPAVAIPELGNIPAGDAFRLGIALRIGLGREFSKGPLFASLSVSLFGRLEGAVAAAKALAPRDSAADANALLQSYIFYLQGEIGIILEIEGRVDLRLIQARVLIRAWIAAGVTLASRRPIILHAEAGVDVRVKFAIGRIKIFGKKITIYITLSYSTTLRYEWELKGGPQMLALAAAPSPSAWRSAKALSFAAAPLHWKLAIEISRRGPGRAVMVPMATVLKSAQGSPHPFQVIATALLGWAIDGELTGSDPLFQRFTIGSTAPTVQRLTAKLRTFSTLSDTQLDAFLAKTLAGSTIELAVNDAAAAPAQEEKHEGYAVPLPPMLAFKIAGTSIDFTGLPKVTDDEVDAIAKGIARQFAQQSVGTAVNRKAAGTGRPLVAHMFRDWLESLALNTLDAMQNGWTTNSNDPHYEQIAMSKLLGEVDWEEVAGRTGRYLFGGVRIARQGSPNESTIALLDKAGLMLDVPASDFTIELASAQRGWLDIRGGTLTILGTVATEVGKVDPKIRVETRRPEAVRRVSRRFDLPDIEPFTGAGMSQLVRFTADLRGQLGVPLPKDAPALLGRLALWWRDTAPQGEIEAMPQAARFAAVTAFSVRLPAVKAKPDGSAVIEILGTSEAERRPLDALFPLGEADPVLNDATIHLAVQGKNGLEIFQEAAGLAVARATTVRERQPGEDAKALISSNDDLFLAPASDIADFVKLLRRAAIVNAVGTYLLLDKLSEPVRKLLAEADARISLVIAFPASANERIPARGINAALLEKSVPAGKRLIAMAKGEPWPQGPDRLFETVSLREPGSALLRFWRRPPDEAADTAEAHLDAMFDMLEFGVEGDGGKMPIEQSLPLSSEYVERDNPGNYTDEQHKDFVLPDGWDKGLRYDLLVPLYRWAKPTKTVDSRLNPYEALRQDKFTIQYGWRDIFGNRLGSTATETVVPYYEDALEPVSAWPGVGFTFSVSGDAGKIHLRLFNIAKAGLSVAERTNLLLKVIHQLEGPYVEAVLESDFGSVDTPKGFAGQLAAGLRTLLDAGTVSPWSISLTPWGKAKHPRFDLRLTVRRTKGWKSDSPADVRAVTNQIKLVRRGPVSGNEADPTWLAREFRKGFESYMLARGVDDDGSSQWWAVDRRLLPTARKQAPDVLAQPPLALAALSASNVAFTTFVEDNGAWSEVSKNVDVPSIDSDTVFGDLLDRIERFVGPAMAPDVTRHGTAFSKVMKAKYALLRPGDTQPLLSFVRAVADNGPAEGSAAAKAAQRVLRQAAGNDFRAFYEVAAMLVQPMTFASGLPKDWFGTGEAAPKLHGRLKFAAGDTNLRSMTYGIPLTQNSAIAIALFRDQNLDATIKLSGKISFEVTHIEREVEEVPGGEMAAPAASRWLSLIPIDKDDGWRTIDVTGGALSVAAPVRALPRPPLLSRPRVARSERGPVSASYDDLIASICRWRYGFDLTGLTVNNDEACCRLVYNVDPTASEIKDTKTAAAPLFPGLAAQLARCKQAMTGIWEILADPSNAQFGRACELFADLATGVADAILTAPLRVRSAPERAEDRFIVQRKTNKTLGFRFFDHVDNVASYPIALDTPQADIGDSGWKAVGKAETSFVQATPSDKPLPIDLDGMMVQRLQSVWAAASIRRNAGMHKRFTYRTEELFVQEPVIPYLEERGTILLDRTKKEPLRDRLLAALKPLFGVSSVRRVAGPGTPAQLRLAVESVRLFEKLEASGHIAEPAPKVQLITDGGDNVQAMAATLAQLFIDQLGGETLGPPTDARIILSVLMLTKDRQPLLDIRRIAIPLTGLVL